MSRLVLRGGLLIDGEHPPRPADVAVEGERIVAVDAPGAIEARPEDRSCELGGRSLMPGLVSCHFHTTFEGVQPMSAPKLGLHAPAAMLTLIAAKNMRIALECGVTGAICSSTAYGIDPALQAAIGEGWLPGPRILCGSHELLTTGDISEGGMRNWYMQLGNDGLVRTADGPDAFRKRVREEIKRGAEIVKLCVSQGHNAGPTGTGMNLSREELRAAVDAAHARGKRVRAHAVSREAIIECARAGVDIIDHADQIDSEGIEAVGASGSAIVPSAFYVARVLECVDAGLMAPFLPDPVPPQVEITMRSMREDSANMLRRLPELQAAGVTLLAGDDFGTAFLPHGDYGAELAYYVKHASIAPLEVLGWATRNGGRVLAGSDELGTIAPGRLADLLVVEGDPVADIGCLQSRPLAVLRGGEVVAGALPCPQAA